MQLTKSSTLIDGIYLTPLKIFSHPQGDLYHAIKKSSPYYQGFGEAYFSTIKQHEIKTWRKHFKATCNLIVPLGKIKFVLIDDRKGSSTKNIKNEVVLSLENYCRLTISPNIWMAFQGLESNNLVMNFSNLEHDPEESVKMPIETFPFNLDKI